MFELFARDLILEAAAQDILQTIPHLDEALCRRAVVAVIDASALPLSEATEALLAGLREQDGTRSIVAAFWDKLSWLSREQGDGEATQPLRNAEDDPSHAPERS